MNRDRMSRLRNSPYVPSAGHDQAGVSRRAFLGRGALLGGAVALSPALLAACGGDDDSGSDGGGDAGSFTLGTWVFYIDGDDAAPQDSPTIQNFTDSTGISVNYKVDVDDNNTFTATVQPKLEKGEATGYDLVVLTSWMVERWIRNGWVETLDAAAIPNTKNLLARLRKPAWDPTGKYSMPYAEGQVGIAYYPDEVGFEMKDVKDLLDPRVKGKVTILSEMRDSLGMFMLSEGLNPETATVDQALGVLKTIEQARDDGQFRKITGNSYTDDLSARDAVASLAWSGDVVGLQAEQPDLVWVAPEAGQMTFVDVMIVPKAARNQRQAEEWVNYLYDPAVSGPLFEFISYVSPVDGATDYMSDEAKSDPLINPPADAKLYDFRILTEEESDRLENAFAQATQL